MVRVIYKVRECIPHRYQLHYSAIKHLFIQTNTEKQRLPQGRKGNDLAN